MSLEIGERAPAFSLPAVGGTTATLGDGPATVVVFSCNHCPYVMAWEGRLNDIARDYAARGVSTVAINANDAVKYPADSFEAMEERAADRGFVFAYARDERQEVARAYGAERTPEVFVVDGAGRVAYHGAVDDSREAAEVGTTYLRDALDAVLGGSAPATAETPAVGCTIKWR